MSALKLPKLVNIIYMKLTENNSVVSFSLHVHVKATEKVIDLSALFKGDIRFSLLVTKETRYCAAYQRSAICDEFWESDGCSLLIG